MRRRLLRVFGSQQFGLVLVILLVGMILTGKAGTHMDNQTGHVVNNFLNLDILIQVFTKTSFFAVMAVGMAAVIISAGSISRSVQSMPCAPPPWRCC